MKFNKVFSDRLRHCYALLHLKNECKDYIVVASEEDDACYAYDLNNHYQRTTVWEHVGGTMTAVQIPGTLNFLATQRFYPGFNSKSCRIVKETFNGLDWDQQVIGDFPYVHRFDIVPNAENTGYWFIGCSIANSKTDTDDWSDPGKIWVGKYDDKKNTITCLRALDQRITKNHGYRRMNGYSYITGVEGIFKLVFPDENNDWQLIKVSDRETSDIYEADINNDGCPEYLTIEGFHGPSLRISDSNFKTISVQKNLTPFGHAIWGGNLAGKNCFIFGWRDGDRNLEILSEDFKAQLIDTDVGPSNVLVYSKQGHQYILSANREISEVAVYEVE